MKKILKLSFVLTLLLLTMAAAVFATDLSGQAGNDITWTITNDTLTFTGKGDMPDYSWYDNKSPWYTSRQGVKNIVVEEGITSIGACAFKDAEDVVKITIPAGVKSIGKDAFYGCEKLTSLVCPDGLDEIKSGAFHGCTSLQSITFSTTLKSIGDNAFFGCENLNAVTFPEGITYIGTGAFQACKSLRTVKIPSSVKRVEASCFEGCSGLSSVELLNGVMYISERAFRNCFGLSSITLPESLGVISRGAFEDCRSLSSIRYHGKKEDWSDIRKGINNTPIISAGVTYLEKDGPKIIAKGECGEKIKWELNSSNKLTITGTGAMENYGINGPNAFWYPFRERVRTVEISEGITSIGNCAFRDCSELTKITLPSTITSIGNYAFSNCRNLKSISLPYGLITIGKNAFADCSVLEGVTIPDSVTSIGDNAFFKCRLITSIVIPNSVTSLGAEAFIYCTGLKTVYLGDGIAAIGDRTFKGSAVTNITIPACVTSIGDGVFSDCEAEIIINTFHTQDTWKNVKIGEDNAELQTAKVVFTQPEPEVPETPEEPEASETPETSETPEVPEVPETPETSETPEEPETPAKPSNEITILLNGKAVDCEAYGQKPTIINGRTLVPLRAIFEALGATVEWDDQTRTVSSSLGQDKIKLTIGEPTLYKNDAPVTLDVPAMIISDRTMVPARAIAEAYGVNVEWNGETRTVILTTDAE